jgi:hypothetical protein
MPDAFVPMAIVAILNALDHDRPTPTATPLSRRQTRAIQALSTDPAARAQARRAYLAWRRRVRAHIQIRVRRALRRWTRLQHMS